MLRNAGLCFETVAPHVDERAATKGLTNPMEIARTLAARKALAVAETMPNAVVIGADQTLDCHGRFFHKPQTREAAAAQLLLLAGHEHRLHSAVAICRHGRLDWQHLASVRLLMRPLTEADIAAYLDRAGDAVLSSVGAYQVEGLGIQLFERIDGDWFAILGLPLLPLLTYLRSAGGTGL